MSSSTKFSELPPSYDHVVEINNPSAPLLHQTFSGSIFGTSSVATMELATQSFPVTYSSFGDFPKSCDYSFVIRDFLGSVQAKGNVSNLNTTLENVNGAEILQIRPVIEPTNQRNTIEPFSSKMGKICTLLEEKTGTYAFDILQNKVPFGLVKYAKKESAEDCLKIHLGNENDEMVVKSLAPGDYAIFRDHVSTTPICNIQIAKTTTYEISGDSFKAKIIFHQQTGITTEEQLLCTAAAISIEVSLTHLCVSSEIDSKHKEIYFVLIFIAVLGGIVLLSKIFLSML